MNDLLKMLWLGKLNLERVDLSDPEYEALLKTEQSLYEALVQSVGFEATDQFATAQNALCSYLCQQRFQRGFCLGGQLILAILSEDFTHA